MVRVGLIGLGFMGKVHLGAYNKIANAEVVAISDVDPRRAAGDLTGEGADNIAADTITQLDMSKIKGTTDAQELLGFAEVDLVDICLPTPFHRDIVLAALATGKHVLCEKPLARTSTEADQIAAAAAAASGMFMPAMCMRFWPQWAWLKKTIDAKTYGAVKSATFRRGGQMPGGWFSRGEWSGGALLDLHIHDTDFVYHLFGQPHSVTSSGYSKTSGEIDHIVTQYHFEGTDAPPLVYAEGGWCLADGYGFRMMYTVNFEHATVDFDLAREKQPLLLYTEGKADPIQCEEAADGYELELRYYVNCIEKGVKPTTVTAEDAAASIRISEAEGRSVAEGKTIVL